jgi:hypothetical protein
MHEKQKNAIISILGVAKQNVENRRASMVQALEDLGETVTIILDGIEGLPPGFSVMSVMDQIMIGPLAEGGKIEAPVVRASVVWVEADEDEKAHIEYLMFWVNDGAEASVAYKDLTLLAKDLAEPLIEDVFKLEDQRQLLLAQKPQQPQNGETPPVQPSAPPDDAAKVHFQWKCLGTDGKVKEGKILALNETDARDRLHKLDYEVISLEPIDEAH